MRIKLNNVRISFCQSLFTAAQYQGKGAFRHSAAFLIVPGSENDKKIKEAIIAAAALTWDKKATATLKSIEGNSNKYCYMSGDLKEFDGYAGMMALGSHRKQEDGPPLVLDKDKSPLGPNSGKPYGGCYVNASIDIYAQAGENPGIRCGLMGVQFFADGDSFGGAGKAEADDFDDLSTDADDLA